MEIIKDTRNNLLKRQEISISLEAEKNPNFDEMKKQILEKFGKSEEVVDVYNIKGSFGSHEFKIDAYIYDSKEDLEKAKSKKKQEVKKEEKVEETPVEKIEKKSEEKVAEAPAEEKPEQEEKAVEEEKQAEEEAKEN